MCNKPWCTCEDVAYHEQELETLRARALELECERNGVAGALLAERARTNALRDALEQVREFILTEYRLSASEMANTGGVVALEAYHAWESVNAALAAHPAASLAAHDAEVLERARDAAHNAIHDAVYEKGECDRIKAAVDDAIRALAAQEVKP